MAEKEKINEKKNEKKVSEELETFNNHWKTGHFLGPNTLRYEENRRVYEEEERSSEERSSEKSSSERI